MLSSSREHSALRALLFGMRAWRKRLGWMARVDLASASKRAMDILVSLSLLIILSPLMALVALLIKLTDGGPVLHWQTRVGRHGRLFPFPKFRSMVPNAEKLQAHLLAQSERQGVGFKMKRDPRVTWIGRIIRRTSIDELPQLWCVLKGDMTLVGPRPPLPREVAAYTLHDRRRLEAATGLTCIWQVSGRADVSFDRQVEMDIDYIHHASPLLDLKLLLLTIKAVITGKGAY